MFPVRFIAACVCAAASCAGSFEARAAGTAAGTSIQNTAQVSYQVGASTVTASSNTTVVTVAEILDAVVTIANPTVTAAAGATQQELVFTITNTGNGTETFELVGLSAGITGDDFDPTLSVPAIYFDTDGSGNFSGGDVAYSPGAGDPTLAPDASVRFLLLNDIPNVSDGSRGRSRLTARARTGVGNPGTAFAGLGDGGVDAVAGTTRGEGSQIGEYVVEALQLTLVKSQTIQDQFGGNRPIPGARINYQIVVTSAGDGVATAAVFSDAIPANTTYVAGSLELNSAALSDSGGNDAGEFTSTPVPQVRVNLGDLSSASGAQTIEFAVTIN
jgi:uncharacterized repeat protein (TIGR01451 family)